MVNTRPITMISCGDAKRYREQDMKAGGKKSWDVKPDMKDIVKWI